MTVAGDVGALQPKRNEFVILWRKYVQRTWHIIEWPVILLFVLIVLGLGYFGLKNYYGSLGQVKSLPDILYSILQLFILGSNYVGGSINFELEIVRLLAPLFPFYMIIKLFGTIFQEKVQLFYLKRLVREHVIIGGMNPRALLLARDFYEHGYRIVVIDNNLSKGMLEKCRDMDAIVLAGSPADPELLEKAQIQKARYFIAVGDNEGANAEAAVNAGKLAGTGKGKALTCYVHIADLGLWGLLRGFQLKLGKADTFRIEFINIYNSGARVLLDIYPAPDEGAVILGLGRLGENLAIEAARSWYFNGGAAKHRLILVDRIAKEKKDSLLHQYPCIGETCDIITLDVDIQSQKFLGPGSLGGLAEYCRGARIYVCPADDASGISIALALLPYLKQTPLVLCTEQESGLAGLINGNAYNGRLMVFPLMSEAYKNEVLLGGINMILARALHEDYVLRQKASGVEVNPAMVPWDLLPEDLKESNRRSADDIMAKLTAVGCDLLPLNDWGAKPIDFTPNEIEIMSVMEHERWVKERTLQGYTYAPGPKDLEKKTSPYLVEWDKLSEDVKELDRNVVRGIPVFLAKEGFQVYRLSGESALMAAAGPPLAT